jgi:RNase H-fold protein (predicted Holliday junction resolvase)
MILGFDPGKDKCGVAIVDGQNPIYHRVVSSEKAIPTLQQLMREYAIEVIVMGNLTTSKLWQQKLLTSLGADIPIVLVDEHNSTLEARTRYWQMYPPKGLQKLIPEGMRLPPRAIDDLVAILLVERYQNLKTDDAKR